MNNAKNTTLFPYLERLLEGEEVQWKTLGEVCKIKNGKDYKHLSNGSVPVYGSGGVMKYVNEAIYSQPSVLIPRKGSLNNLFFVDPPFWNVDTIYYTEINTDYILPKFFYYYLVTLELEKLNLAGGVPSLTQSTLNKLSIPIPPLRVQARIVEILDKFTELEKELEAELEARKKQYAYYRDQLLNFSQSPPLNVNIEWKTLGEVCLVQRGASPRPIAHYLTSSSDGIPWIKIGDTKVGSKYIESTQERITIEGAQRSRQLSAGDFILSNSMSYGRPYILKIDGAIHDGWASLSEISSSILSDYLFYFLSSSKVQMYWEGKINSGSVSNLNADIIKALPIPIPPLSEQRRIVDILDRFDTLTNSISEGLPKEIALRRKQYEYYRDALLSFPRAEVTA